MRSQRVQHNWAVLLSLSFCKHNIIRPQVIPSSNLFRMRQGGKKEERKEGQKIPCTTIVCRRTLLLETDMATHSSILVWRIPWTEEPSRQQSMGLQRVGYDLAAKQQQMYLGVWKVKAIGCFVDKPPICPWTYRNPHRRPSYGSLLWDHGNLSKMPHFKNVL